MHDDLVEGVLHERRGVRYTEEARRVRLVVREEHLLRRFAVKPIGLQLAMGGEEADDIRGGSFELDAGLRRAREPRPVVPEPERRQEVQRRRLGAAVDRAHPNQNVFRCRLRILHEDIEIAIVVEDPRVEQLVLGIGAPATPVLLHELRIGKCPLRVLVETLHVRVAGDVVQVEVVLLHVLAVVAFVAGQAEHPLLQDRIGAVPEREREAQLLALVADAGDAVLAPAIGARAGVIVAEAFPGGPVLAVVFAHRAPLALAEVGSPAPPCRLARARRIQSFFFCGVGHPIGSPAGVDGGFVFANGKSSSGM